MNGRKNERKERKKGKKKGRKIEERRKEGSIRERYKNLLMTSMLVWIFTVNTLNKKIGKEIQCSLVITSEKYDFTVVTAGCQMHLVKIVLKSVTVCNCEGREGRRGAGSELMEGSLLSVGASSTDSKELREEGHIEQVYDWEVPTPFSGNFRIFSGNSGSIWISSSSGY